MMDIFGLWEETGAQNMQSKHGKTPERLEPSTWILTDCPPHVRIHPATSTSSHIINKDW